MPNQFVRTGSAKSSPEPNRRPRYRRPQAHAIPAAAPVGAKVHIRGNGFQNLAVTRGRIGETYGIALNRVFQKPFGCDITASARHRVTIDGKGRLRGWFIVPDRGGCDQTDFSRDVTPARYWIIIGCGTCDVGGRFRVIKDQ